MKIFAWDTYLLTHLPDVDSQHKKLVDIINRLGEEVSSSKSGSTAVIDEIVAELVDYAQYHFREEEQMMGLMKVDARHIDRHCNEHRRFIEELDMIRSPLSGEMLVTPKGLLEFLIDWLTYHILGVDKNLARQISLIEGGMDPEQALGTSEEEVEKATSPLLMALKGLFQQISERNRDLLRLNRTLEQKVQERTAELAEANTHLQELASTDMLTLLPNRRHAMLCLEALWRESQQADLPLSLVIIDADNFKQVNDTCGHDAGDQVLKALSARLLDAFRSDDIVCRMGGDEFMAICPKTPLSGALQIAEMARCAVNELQVDVNGGHWAGSISVGVACRDEAIDSIEALIKCADNAVYQSKRDGRNRVSPSPSQS